MRLFLSLLFTLFLSTSFAQQTLRGYILDADTDFPVSGVHISATIGSGTVSNASGYFELDIPNASSTLLCTHISYYALTENPPELGWSGDTLRIYMTRNLMRLNEVVVTAFEEVDKPILEVAGAIGAVEPLQLQRYSGVSIVGAMNTVSGVRMEQRSPGSYRLSIRGNLLRSPFDVRNVKVYWNDLPFTEANGSSFLHVMEPNMLGAVHILKGPVGSIYGAGNGGTALFYSQDLKNAQRYAELSTTLGSYGLWKTNAGLKWTIGETGGLQIQYGHQQAEGYRDHTALDRDVLAIQAYHEGKRMEAYVFGFYADLFYELPGGLTLEQYEENPRQARPRNNFVAGSEEQDAHIDRQYFYGGLKTSWDLAEKWRAESAVFVSRNNKTNPFNTNYKIEKQMGMGSRNTLHFEPASWIFPTKFVVGHEYQQAWNDARNFGNVGGVKDTINFSDDIIPQIHTLFGQMTMDLLDGTELQLGLSYNRTKYHLARVDYTGTYKAFDIPFPTVLAPRIALSHRLRSGLHVYGTISSGFSNPTVDEVRTSEGSINRDLRPERGINYELGVRASSRSKSFHADASVYYLPLTNAIVRKTDEIGTVLFHNAGGTRNIGAEMTVSMDWVQNPERRLSRLHTWASYSYLHYRFSDYVKDGNDFSGNRVTGVAPHLLSAGLDWEWGQHVYGHWNYNYTAAIPLNDANTVEADGYHLIETKIGYRRHLGINWDLDVSGGVNNLLNQRYSLGNDINAFGNRYYQAAAPINFYGKIALRYWL